MFFFHDAATTRISTLSLHDALPILLVFGGSQGAQFFSDAIPAAIAALPQESRTRLLVTQQARADDVGRVKARSEEHTSELQSQSNLVCRLLLEKKKYRIARTPRHLL